MENNAERTNETPKPSQTVVVKYGYLGFVGEFEYRGNRTLVPSQPVLIETDRGIELGRVLCYSGETENGLDVDSNQINKYLQESGPEYLKRNAGKVVRPAEPQDLVEEQHIHADAINKKKYCMEMAQKLNLNLKIICVEHLFGGERIIFYFTAEGRIDFRELVRDLAREYQTRIELRQIGARDEARLLADYEICGRECCCKNCLKTLRPVNMKMAKLQKATLDPSKVSGRCGRLRCCLRFEQKTYEDLVSRLPNIGSWVQTSQGVGRVKDRVVLTQLVQVIIGERLVTFPVEEVTPAAPEQATEKIEPQKKEVTSQAEDIDETDEISTAMEDNEDRRETPPPEETPRSNQQPSNTGVGDRPAGQNRRSRRNRGKKRRR